LYTAIVIGNVVLSKLDITGGGGGCKDVVKCAYCCWVDTLKFLGKNRILSRLHTLLLWIVRAEHSHKSSGRQVSSSSLDRELDFTDVFVWHTR